MNEEWKKTRENKDNPKKMSKVREMCFSLI